MTCWRQTKDSSGLGHGWTPLSTILQPRTVSKSSSHFSKWRYNRPAYLRRAEIEAQENEAKLITGSANDETSSISTLCRCIVPVASGLLVQMLVRYHLQSRTSIQNSTGEEEHWFTRKCYQRHSEMRIPEELVSRSFCRRFVPFCRASSRYAGPKFPTSKFSRISRRGNRSSRKRFAFCVFEKTDDEELFRKGQRKRKDMGSGCKKSGEKNEERERKCGNLEKNTKRMKHICSWMNLTHETVSNQTLQFVSHFFSIESKSN